MQMPNISIMLRSYIAQLTKRLQPDNIMICGYRWKKVNWLPNENLCFRTLIRLFLNLFPNFIERYNSLFVEGETKANDKQKSLTTEMRIFALIRLGITDSERIAKFLNYSIHTINTYKTRVKNKSWVDNDQFEARIMEI